MTALSWSVSISAVLIIGAYLTDGSIDVMMSSIRFILLFLSGLLIGRLSWRSGEAVFLASEKYKNDAEL